MAEMKDMVGRLGLLGVALLLCVLKWLYTFTLELHSTGGEAAYVLIIHDLYVIAMAWTILLAVLVLTTGAAAVADMGKLKFLHSSYYFVMSALAAYSILNDAVAMAHAAGAHNYILLVQFILELVILFTMGQQFWVTMKSLGQQGLDAARSGLGDD